jgi:hypothetical protein
MADARAKHTNAAQRLAMTKAADGFVVAQTNFAFLMRITVQSRSFVR